MIDEQKLLQWIADKKYVYGGPYDNVTEEKACVGVLNILRVLKRDIELGEFEETPAHVEQNQEGVRECTS